ncbi:hypothetical protein CEXT_676281 [Caerostris extrusa]|uniref:PBZ-type domain-containing protein n=1 Tax=Caerostris extrusa TaxID=172846 RepID=A0AAV4WS06_CAEEX|nr:hypothetical protein CEXT_676281 [Caerostris extrusa]
MCRRNQNHTDQFCHPGDSDYASEPESTQKNDVVEMSEDEECSPKKECPYGDNCFRRNPQHKKDFKHTKKSAHREKLPSKQIKRQKFQK